MHEVLQSVLGLRIKFGDRVRILIQKMDVKNTSRRIPVDHDGAAAFATGWGVSFRRFALTVRVPRLSGVVRCYISGDAACTTQHHESIHVVFAGGGQSGRARDGGAGHRASGSPLACRMYLSLIHI